MTSGTRTYRLAQRLARSDGFSLIELAISLAVFGLIATMTAGLLASGLRGTLLAKRREVATVEASRVLELARSLAFNELGLSGTDPTVSADPAIIDQAGVLSYEVETGDIEPIMWAANASGHPFDPHMVTSSRASTDLTTWIYVTGHDENADGHVDLKRVTAVVSWDDSGTGGPDNSVTVQTLVHPGGQITTPAWTGAGGGGNGLTPMTASVSSSGLTGATRVGVGDLGAGSNATLPEDAVVLSNPTTTGASTFRALSVIDCSARSAFLQDPAGTTYGGHPVAVSADDDARTGTSSTPPSATWSGSDPVNGADETNRLLAEASLTSSASCAATTSDADGLAPTDDDLPLERGSGSTDTPLNLVQDITGAGMAGDQLTVVHTDAQAVSQEIDHAIVAATREVHASGSGSIGATEVMAIDGDIPDGLVSVSTFDYSASVAASPATPSQAPEVTADVFTVKVFDPQSAVGGCDQRIGSYCHLDIDADGPGFSGRTVFHTGTLSANGGLTQITYEIDLQALAPMADPLEGEQGVNGEQRWDAGFVPLQVSVALTIDVTQDGVTTRYVDADTDLTFGTVNASACAGVACR